MNEKKGKDFFLIAAATPQFLERGALWFSEREESILQALREQKGIWANSVFCLEKEKEIKPTVLCRTLSDFGYEKTSRVFGKGEFASRGNIIEIAPINRDGTLVIEFYGNTIEEIREEPIRDEVKKIVRTTDRPFRSGDYVVHLDHGIGVYRGTVSENEIQNTKHKIRNSAKNANAFFAIEYAAPRAGASPDMLYVPVSQKKKVELYVGFETPTVHRLGGNVWFKTRAKAREEIERFAKELLELYRKRATEPAPILMPEPELEKQFAESFPHEETPDQLQAIAEIFSDLGKTRPMDRVLAGDVGFGKTEVALRAALRAVANGYSVILLAPTTVLVHEHLHAFRARFKNMPLRVEALSRLTPPSRARVLIESFKNGSCDILIGTHRLLSESIAKNFPERLGLLIIDEEQRFGVKQKERLKNLRPRLHVLSLSATPIPRTLSLALAGIRDLSHIQTPPPKRIPIMTFVLPYRETLIKDAILRELSRNGQVFFLHNRVETLPLFQRRLRALIPSARISCIHGRTSPRELTRTLDDFRNRRIDVLAATTIIENGLDFPNANTLIVEDASRLGLSEAHQLRGRIGRSDRESYAYFLYRSKALSEKAMLRLEALRDASGFGAGYDLALRDLEIRGAGNVLGREQSGTANKVGLNLYFAMLAEAVEQESKK